MSVRGAGGKGGWKKRAWALGMPRCGSLLQKERGEEKEGNTEPVGASECAYERACIAHLFPIVEGACGDELCGRVESAGEMQGDDDELIERRTLPHARTHVCACMHTDPKSAAWPHIMRCPGLAGTCRTRRMQALR